MEEKLVLINEENGCDEEQHCHKESTIRETFTSNKFSEIFQEIGHTKDKISENDPNFQRSKIHQDTENIYTSYCKL